MQRYVIKLAYNGFNYHGWQMQDNAHSVQAEISEKLTLLLNENISIVGCGRTDTGVHAREFFAHFEIEELKFSEKDLMYKLNNFLPIDIVIYNIYQVPDDFHTRFSAISRTYRYYISTVKNPFSNNTCFHFFGNLDIAAMNKACNFLFEYKDFTSFSKLHTQTATNNCKIEQAVLEFNNNEFVFTITADRFLRNIVRVTMGTLLEIGTENLKSQETR